MTAKTRIVPITTSAVKVNSVLSSSSLTAIIVVSVLVGLGLFIHFKKKN